MEAQAPAVVMESEFSVQGQVRAFSVLATRTPPQRLQLSGLLRCAWKAE